MNALGENTGYESATYVADLSEHYILCTPRVRQQAAIWLNGNEVAYNLALDYHNSISEMGMEKADNRLYTFLNEMMGGDYNRINHTTTYIKSLATVLRYRIEPIVNMSGIYMTDVKIAYIEEAEVDEWTNGTLYLRLNYPGRYQTNINGRSYGA